MKYFKDEDLNDQKEELYKTSKSDNEKNQPLSEEQMYLLPKTERYEVYNFDKLTELVAEKFRKNKKTKSADAFFVNKKDEFYLIEFKNTPKNHMPRNELFYKAYDSILPIQLLFGDGLNIGELCKKLTYIVVYNNNVHLSRKCTENPSASFEAFGAEMAKLAKVDKNIEIYFGLEIYKDVFFKNIYTIDKEDFIQNYEPDIFG